MSTAVLLLIENFPAEINNSVEFGGKNDELADALKQRQ